MRYDFSAQFLRVLPPDTNFGEAWESLCFALLSYELGHKGLTRLQPPDRGIDIWHRLKSRAYQCKSHQQGALGNLDAIESINSLKMAFQHKASFEWHSYCFATNANYTGAAFEKILDEAVNLGLSKNQIEHLGPEYWNGLCEKFSEKISDRFDYRVTATTDQVIDAFRKARYFDRYVQEYEQKIKQANFSLVITNNRTPIEIEIPFSPDLCVENYLDVAKELLGISLEWTNFPDLDTSAGPSLSVTIDRKAQPFSTKIGHLPIKPGERLQLWITIAWRDKQKDDGVSIDNARDTLWYHCLNLEMIRPRQRYADEASRRQLTVNRKEDIIQAMIWQGVHSLLLAK